MLRLPFARFSVAVLVPLFVQLLVVACGDSEEGAAGASGTDAAGSSGAGDGGAITGPAVEVGSFSVQLDPPREATLLAAARAGSTTIIGTVGDKPKFEAPIWDLERQEAGCQLLVPRVPRCDPGCGREVCVEDNTCEPNRSLVDVGTVTVSGVTTTDGASEVELIAVQNTYQNGRVTLPYPAFDEGDPITLSATGAASVPAFEIVASGVAPVVVIDPAEYLVEAGQDLALSWTVPEHPDISRIQIRLDISHHGGAKGKIVCDVEDNGAFTLPGALIGELIELGIAGFPSVVLERSSDQTAQLPIGRVRLWIHEYAERFVTIPGLVSCTADAHCPMGQICNAGKACE